MKMKFAFVALMVFGCLSASALDREAFTFTKYELNVRIESEQQRLGVRGKISLRNDSTIAQRSLSLQISSSLNWSSIQLQGQPVEFVSQNYTSDIDHTGAVSEAIVVLPQLVAPKQTIELKIGYEGVIAQDATRLTRIGVNADEAKDSDWDRIGQSFTAVRGIGHVAWYPVALEAVSLSDINGVPEAVAKWKQREDQAQVKVTLDYSQNSREPSPEMLCNGTEANKTSEDLGSAQHLTADCSYRSLNGDVPSFVIAPYSDISGKDVQIHYLPDHKAGAGDYASAVEEVSPLIGKWFSDHRLPAEAKSDVVDLPDPNDGSFESGNMLFMPLTGSDTKLLLAATQQLTHIYFRSPRAWIREGLAAYAQARLIEEKEGRKAAIDYLQARRTGLVELEKLSHENKDKDDSLISSVDDFRIQTKSMYVWWMLRDMVGESALYAGLHNYKAMDDTDPKYMQGLIESQAHRDLQWFFDDWVYHDRGLPDFHVTSVYPNKLASGGYMVTVVVENRGEAGAEIPVTLHTQGSEASGKLVVAGNSKASIRIQCPSLPLDATLNDGSVPESDSNNDVYKIDR